LKARSALRLILPVVVLGAGLAAAALFRAPPPPPPETVSARVADPQIPFAGIMNPGAVGHVLGHADAPVTVVEYSDFGCPYCRVFALETYPALHREYVETGRVRWRYVPFVIGSFTNGAEAARAAVCAAEQGEDAFWAMRGAIYQGQTVWRRAGEPESLFRGYASEIALDQSRYDSCYREDRSHARVHAGGALAAQAAVRGTPTFFVNGMRVQGALHLDQFRRILDEAAR